jgi:hypothetical protein
VSQRGPLFWHIVFALFPAQQALAAEGRLGRACPILNISLRHACGAGGERQACTLIAFAALAFPLARTGRFGLIPVLIGASAFGGMIELIQPTFNRSADVNDWIADTLGVLIGIALGLAYRRARRHRN